MLFTYNDEGIRTSKTVGTTEHIYRLDGSKIIAEEVGLQTFVYMYDAEGTPIGMQYITATGSFDTYWFAKNLQGDIVAVYDENGTKLISYKYDAWGKFTTTYHNGCTASSTAAKNPFRYRGYYYDTETGLYYLQSRYYDPAVGRFINADVYVSTGQGILGNNMFAYCLNNPVCMADYGGKDAIYVTSPFLVFGHAELYIQDVEGNWYVTEYVGQGFDASTARIKVYPANMEMVSTMINGGDISNLTYSYIEGDFTRSLNRAFELDGSNYGGYDLVVNNCLHYVKELITYGDFDNFLEGVLAKNSWQIIPKRYHDVLETGRKLGELYEEAKNYVSEMLENIWDWFH